MRPLDACRTAWTVMALWAGLAAAVLGADTASPSSASLSTPAPLSVPAAKDPDEVLRQALDLERQREWTAAIELYEDALEQWPGRADLRHRLRLCESHYRLGRRYQDQSFRDVLLQLSPDDALALYDEILERIQNHYVEPVAVAPLLRRGLDNMEVALRDPRFLQLNAPNSAPDRILWLRRTYQSRRAQVVANDREDAKRLIVACCEQARQAAEIRPSAVILEFAFGACDALPDDYSSYLTPDKLDDLYAQIDGNFVGLGVELKLDPEGLLLVNILRGGPASEAGLRPGDRITGVDGLSLKGMGLDESAGKLQGVEGSAVTIAVLHTDGSNQTFRLVRRSVEVQSVAEAKMVDPSTGIGYIQLTGFQKTSADELRSAVRTLQIQGMRGLILDLRGNPGGLLNMAVEIADLFLDQGVIVSTRGRAPDQSYTYKARVDGAWTMPLSVLIDHDSASASEILAGALRDHRRATIVGERSYGKGSVQSIFPLRAAPAGLKLTTAKFYSPQNRPYSEQGVEPDLEVHTAAKPDGIALTPGVLGDPEKDSVLRTAILQARRQLTQGR